MFLAVIGEGRTETRLPHSEENTDGQGGHGDQTGQGHGRNTGSSTAGVVLLRPGAGRGGLCVGSSDTGCRVGSGRGRSGGTARRGRRGGGAGRGGRAGSAGHGSTTLGLNVFVRAESSDRSGLYDPGGSDDGRLVVLRVDIVPHVAGLGDVGDGPIVLDHDGVDGKEDVEVGFTGLVLQPDVTLLGRVGQPTGHGADDRLPGVLARRSIRDGPVGAVPTDLPGDRLQPEDLLSDHSDSVVGVSERRPPEGGDSAVVQVRDDLGGPSELGNDLLVGQRGHVLRRRQQKSSAPTPHDMVHCSTATYRMRPGVGSDMTAISDSPLEGSRIVKDASTDHYRTHHCQRSKPLRSGGHARSRTY